jgi:DNA-binding NtrC family response regulator
MAQRAETRARSADLLPIAALARSFRRRVASGSPVPPVPAIIRALRGTVLVRAVGAYWVIAQDLARMLFEAGRLSRPASRVAIALACRREGARHLPIGSALRIFGRPLESLTRDFPRARRVAALATHDIDLNRFRSAARRRDMPERVRVVLARLSLGLLAECGGHDLTWLALMDKPDRVAATTQVVAMSDQQSPPWFSTYESEELAVLASVGRVIRGGTASDRDCILVLQGLRTETAWARRLVLGMVGAIGYLRRNEPGRAATTIAKGVDGYWGFRRLCRKLKAETPQLLRDYEEHCGKVLAALELPRPEGPEVVPALLRAARRVPQKRRPNPTRVLDALDALVTAGRSGARADIERRVVRDLAKMLGGWTLLHYRDGVYVTERPQEEHTLSTWSLRTLVRDRRIVVRRVRARPEFWRPEQRRPVGLLSLPIGRGVAVIASRRPFRHQEVRAVRTVLRFLEARTSGTHATHVPHRRRTVAAQPLAGEGLIGTSKPWRKVLQLVHKVARSTCSVVLLGETGTGKERLARAIHATSRRSQGPFVAMNCGAVTPSLLASELFGHMRGAFTGADRNRDGVFVRAHRGTLFLDEVADMPADMQVALLRVLEEQRITPVGSARQHDVDVRILSATNKDLAAEVDAGRFREDLYHRLNVIEIRLPPLRRRIADLPLFVAHLLGRLPEPKSLHPDALPILARYPWPGNVRELDNVLRAAALLVDGREISPELLDRILAERRGNPSPARRPAGPRANSLLEALRDRWRSTSELAHSLSLSSRTVNREVARLCSQGLVESYGEARARKYRAAWRDSSRFGSGAPVRP